MKTFSKALILILIMAFYVVGITFGRPEPELAPSIEARAWLNPESVFHPDEFAYAGRAFQMLRSRDWDPHYYHNPSLNIYTDIGLFWLGNAEAHPYNPEWGIREATPFSLYVIARYGSALFSLLTVVLTAVAGRVAFGKTAGNVAAGLVAFSPLVVEHAHFATPNAETSMVSTAALMLALMIMTGRYPKRMPVHLVFGSAGALVGLTFAARYNATVVGLVTAIAFFVAWRRDHRLLSAIVIGCVMMPVAAVIGMPALVLVPHKVLKQIRGILRWYSENGGGPGFTAEKGLPSITAHWYYLMLAGIGAGGLISAAGGVILALRKWQHEADSQQVVVASTLALYIVVYTLLALRGRRLQANLLFTVIVPLALLAGYFVAQLHTHFPIRRRLITGWVIVMLLWPVVISMLFVYRISTSDNRIEAQRWIDENVPYGSRVHLLGPYNVPVEPMNYDVTQSYAGGEDVTFLHNTNAQIIVYSDAYPHTVFRDTSYPDPKEHERETAIRTTLESEWIPLVEFERWPWLFENINPDDVSYWFQMGITIYCNPSDCPVSTST